MILVARILLFTPLFLWSFPSSARPSSKPLGEEMMPRRNKIVAAAGAVLSLSPAFSAIFLDKVSWSDLTGALSSHPAVSALGCDLVICLISSMLWNSRQSKQRL